MRYLSPFLLLLVAFGCSKAPKSGPIINQPTIDTPKTETRIFRGDYILFDSSIYAANSTYPAYPTEDHFTINKVATIEIDSIKKRLVMDRDTFWVDSTKAMTYNKIHKGPPVHWTASEDSVTFAFWTQLPNHRSSYTYVKGYRKK